MLVKIQEILQEGERMTEKIKEDGVQNKVREAATQVV